MTMHRHDLDRYTQRDAVSSEFGEPNPSSNNHRGAFGGGGGGAGSHAITVLPSSVSSEQNVHRQRHKADKQRHIADRQTHRADIQSDRAIEVFFAASGVMQDLP